MDALTVTLPRLLTTRQAAEYLSLQPQTLRDWRANGRGPKSIKVEGAVRYRAVDLAVFVEQRSK